MVPKAQLSFGTERVRADSIRKGHHRFLLREPITMSARRLAVGIALIFFSPLCMAQATPSKTDVEKRVDSILNQMSQEEKFTILGGINDFYTRPIPRLGIPALKMSDGP